MNTAGLLVLLGFVCFILAVFTSFDRVNLIALGLAFVTAARLLGAFGPREVP